VLSDAAMRQAISKHGNRVRRICMLHLKNYADVEDIFQNVFLKYALMDGAFENYNHEKAWIIRVTLNECRDLLKSYYRKHRSAIPLEDLIDTVDIQPDYKELLQAVLSLPVKYKNVIYLYYYEGYSVDEISRILRRNVNTVYTHLTRARNILRKELEGMEEEYGQDG